MDGSGERWLPIPGYEDRYEVSDRGRVRSWVSRPSPRLLSQIRQNTGYVTVALSRGGFTEQQLIHRLVLLAFVGPCPDGMETRHLDGLRPNNRLTNLAYDEANTYWRKRKSGGRGCRACKRDWARAHTKRHAGTARSSKTVTP